MAADNGTVRKETGYVSDQHSGVGSGKEPGEDGGTIWSGKEVRGTMIRIGLMLPIARVGQAEDILYIYARHTLN